MMGTQRRHRRCTLTSTDAHVGGTVEARVKHVIDSRVGKGEEAQSWAYAVSILLQS